MHKLTVRMKDVRSGQIIEAGLDERLSFKENFALLKQMTEIPLDETRVYDPYKKIFLDRNIALLEFHFSSFVLLHLFS